MIYEVVKIYKKIKCIKIVAKRGAQHTVCYLQHATWCIQCVIYGTAHGVLFIRPPIKTNCSESRPRKVELASAIKNLMTTVSILHITTKLVKTPTKQPYHIDIFIS